MKVSISGLKGIRNNLVPQTDLEKANALIDLAYLAIADFIEDVEEMKEANKKELKKG